MSARRPDANTASVFAALGDETRLFLVARLCGAGPLCVTDLTEGVRVTRQAVSKHLRVLEDAGVVRSSRVGRERRWELETQRLEDARRYLDSVSQEWDRALERLRKVVEE